MPLPSLPIGRRPSRDTYTIQHWFEDSEGVEHACDFEFEFHPGSPGRNPDLNQPGEPDEPDGVDLIAWKFRVEPSPIPDEEVEAWWKARGEKTAVEHVYSSADNGVNFD